MEGFLKFINELARGFSRLTPGRQVAFVSVVVLTVAAIAVLYHFMGQTNYAVLYSDLTPEDSGTIALTLQEKNVPYKVSFSGDRVMVPSDRVSELRIELASSGLPLGGGVGFEIFDEKNFGVTEFVQKLNYQRALQGELARTIGGLDEIAGSRVHIVLPEKSIFEETRQKPTASVALRVKPGRRIQPSQVDGIVNLVARSVEGLNPEDVMVVDSSGVMLSQASAQSDEAMMTGSQLEYQRTIENELASRVQTMVEQVVGSGRAIATVSARLDFYETHRTEEIYDPNDPVVRSTHRKTERTTDPSVGNEATVDPSDRAGAEARGISREKIDEVTHYELSRTVSTSVKPQGEIEHLSVAVLVDGRYRENELGEQIYEPRTAEELTQLDELIKRAVGFNQRRGDQVVITNIPFEREEPVDDEFLYGETTWKDTLDTIMPALRAVLTLVALLVVIFFVLRPMSKMVVAAGRASPRAPELPAGAGMASVSELERQREQAAVSLNMAAMSVDESEDVAMVKNMARQDAGTFTELLRGWLR